ENPDNHEPKRLEVAEAYAHCTSAVIFSPDSQTLAACSHVGPIGSTLHFWRAGDGKTLPVIPLGKSSFGPSEPAALRFAPRGKQLGCVTAGGIGFDTPTARLLLAQRKTDASKGFARGEDKEVPGGTVFAMQFLAANKLRIVAGSGAGPLERLQKRFSQGGQGN